MCGIAGIIGCDIKPRTAISAMLSAIAHRGPDDEDVLTDGCATLGHRRLSIIDLAGGRQPISNHDNSMHIVCNGEIYNWAELRKSLEQAGYRFKTKSDTEVILHLYAEHGTDCLKYLRGMFAFAIWDSKRKRLFAARDHLGQKPLFYATVGGDFLFASEIKALTEVSPELRNMSAEAMAQGLPVVCYDHGGQTDYLENGVNGAVLPLNDSDALVSAVSDLVVSVDKRNEMAARNRADLEQLFIDNCAIRYEAIFRTVTGKPF